MGGIGGLSARVGGGVSGISGTKAYTEKGKCVLDNAGGCGRVGGDCECLFLCLTVWFSV